MTTMTTAPTTTADAHELEIRDFNGAREFIPNPPKKIDGPAKAWTRGDIVTDEALPLPTAESFAEASDRLAHAIAARAAAGRVADELMAAARKGQDAYNTATDDEHRALTALNDLTRRRASFILNGR